MEPPPATGVRLDWNDIPARVRAAVEEWLGCGVLAAVTQPTGFSPGVAARIQDTRGRRFFAKAVGPAPNPIAAALHRREARIVRALPPEQPVPRPLWSHAERQ